MPPSRIMGQWKTWELECSTSNTKVSFQRTTSTFVKSQYSTRVNKRLISIAISVIISVFNALHPFVLYCLFVPQIDLTVISLMTDDQLSDYLPYFGDRLALRFFCRQRSNSGLDDNSQKRKTSVVDRLRKSCVPLAA